MTTEEETGQTPLWGFDAINRGRDGEGSADGALIALTVVGGHSPDLW
jgi:hypothetical protein